MYELCPYFTNDGTVGLFSKDDDDIYHSTYGALTESWQKFVIPSGLETYLETHDEVKILDLCYGIGYNTKTALQVFINSALKEKKKKFYSDKKIKKILKNNLNKSLDIATIDTDNIITGILKNPNRNSESNDENTNNDKITHAPIDTDNILANNNDNFACLSIDNKNTYHKKILIDAVDLDKTLINLSPFITRGVRNNLFEKRKTVLNKFSEEKIHSKLLQIQKIQKNKINLLPQNLRLKKETLLVIFEKLLEQSSDKYFDLYYDRMIDQEFQFLECKILNTILNHKIYKPYLSKFMTNFANFYQSMGCKDTKKGKILSFLHNIYYRYLSKSYKNVKNIFKNNKIDINFHNNDARAYIKSANTKYNFMFLDAFTPTKCPSLWTVQFFKELYSKLEDDGMILTYSNSAAVRNAFLQNGFVIGKTFDKTSNKFVGTIAVKDKSLIQHELDERDWGLMNSKAGICFEDENLDLDNDVIIKNRESKVKTSELVSSSKVLKGHKKNNAKSL